VPWHSCAWRSSYRQEKEKKKENVKIKKEKRSIVRNREGKIK
jgi:hypothetical protein